MKKLFILVTLTITMVLSTAGFAQKSSAYTGDKGSKEISASCKIMKDAVTDLRIQVKDFEKKSRNLHSRIPRNPKEPYYLAKVKETDSLLNLYRQKVSSLEDQLIAFTVSASSKDKQNIVQLNSRNVNQFSEAYMITKFADKENANNNVPANGKHLIGLVENVSAINPIIATVTGPANFSVSFTLKSRDKSPEFELPCYGEYTTVFTSKYGIRCVTKRVWPNTTYYDGQKQFDYKATQM